MRLLLDTQLLIWAMTGSDRGKGAQPLIDETDNDVFFSVSSLWEVAIKRALDRPTFQYDPEWLRGHLLRAGYSELPILAPHVVAVSGLPLLHRDPFDRLLIAQSYVEKLTLLTTDQKMASYPGDIRRV